MTRWQGLAGVLAVVCTLSSPGAAPADATRLICVSEAGEAKAAGDSGGEDEDAPPKFTAAFYARMLNLDASLDGAEGSGSLSRSRRSAASRKGSRSRLPSSPAPTALRWYSVARRSWQDGTRLSEADAATALDGADTATLRVRLKRPRTWREDEDGNRIATFRAGRIEVTD